jgi:hypothetical protein
VRKLARFLWPSGESLLTGGLRRDVIGNDMLYMLGQDLGFRSNPLNPKPMVYMLGHLR